jgi:DNA-binding YbaB/EbfC family protein
MMKLPGNMQNVMKQQQRMQEEVEKIVAEGTAGGGMVTVKMDGHKRVLSVKIEAEAAGDAEMLQDMVMVAFNEAHKKVESESQKIMGGMLGGLGLPPGMF